MSSLSPRTRPPRAHALRRQDVRSKWTLALLILAMGAVILLMGLTQDAYAASPDTRGLHALEACSTIAGCGGKRHASYVHAGYDSPRTMADFRLANPLHPGASHYAAQEHETNSPDNPSWVATMTVGESEIASIGYLGFIAGDWPNTGSIDDVTFSHAGVDYVVTALYHPIVAGNPNHLFLHLDMALSNGWTLQVGPDVFDLSDVQVWGPKRNIYHWYLPERMDWMVGDQVPIALTPPQDTGPLREALVKIVPPGNE